ncbi:MAG: UDP-N-acetylmuramate--alanine ligase [Rhodospirillales bacterium]|nr:UDP-N-acetylmuramate--alanine ligase [Rhodospirillales bacterium]MCB9995862.1 UDP-N-acetylmuramate--alanine ligase [Rhodospirillales bacterium]
MSDHIFFCGIGGSGMSALALILCQKGHRVSGSDRGYDKGDSPEKFRALQEAGISLCPQDGSGLSQDVNMLVVSSAVEESVPDVRQALKKGIPVRKRAEILADLFNAMDGIAIAGTSGKTTVTGMTAHMLHVMGLDPTVMNGGQIVNFLDAGLPGNAMAGGGRYFVTETDESDGSIALYNPAIAVVNNITLDHKPLEELRHLFRAFLSRARTAAIVNLDDPEAAQMADIHPNTITFAIDNPAAAITAQTVPLSLRVPGRHNLSNALAALAVAKALGLDLVSCAEALHDFKGIKRRFEVVGQANGITVIDDFGHNPDKIRATLETLKERDGRVIAIFQPHGFGPTKMLKDGLVEVFTKYLGEEDLLLMPEIYYAGGTASKTISSREIIDGVSTGGRSALFMEGREQIRDYLACHAARGNRIVVMGARDDTLSDFARDIFFDILEKVE